MKSRIVHAVIAGIISSVFVFIISGCATNKIHGDKNLLKFLQDGITSKEEVILALGEPSYVYEQESIYTYRLAGDGENGYRLMIGFPGHGWDLVDYSLVLIFDKHDILKKHTLVPVK